MHSRLHRNPHQLDRNHAAGRASRNPVRHEALLVLRPNIELLEGDCHLNSGLLIRRLDVAKVGCPRGLKADHLHRGREGFFTLDFFTLRMGQI
jgi:hypothetical protein